MKSNKCIVNYYSKGREEYSRGSQRLVDSLLYHTFKSDIIIFTPDKNKDIKSPIPSTGCDFSLYSRNPFNEKYGECLPHKLAPYQFKAFAIQHARELGYEQVAWLDSSIVAVKDPTNHFELASEVGVLLYDNPGCPEATWTSDDCLERMGCDIETARHFYEVDAAMMIFDFRTTKANEVFDDYFKYCLDTVCLLGESGSTRPDFRAHRHDQSVISYVARIKHAVSPLSYGAWCYGNEIGKFHPTFSKVGISWPLSGILKVE